MNIKELKNLLEEEKVPAYRLKQILKAIYQDGIVSFQEISTISKDLREKLDKQINILSFGKSEVLVSKKKDAFKAKLELNDGYLIETVLMKQKKGWSVCVSSQVGCAGACVFCATGKMGFKRNLNHEEIISQVLFWKNFLLKNNLEKEITNLVFMGMGEPLLNYEEVKKSILKLTDSDLFAFGSRHISLSSSGIIPFMKRFVDDFPQINLAISIICADENKRAELMPISKKYSLEDIRIFLDFYFERCNRKIFLEYVLFKDINDSRDDAKKLISFVKSCSRSDLLHVNLILYNKTINNFYPTSQENIKSFQKYLEENKISVTLRRSLGDDIDGACGQLAGEK